jgi:hypothetical protein
MINTIKRNNESENIKPLVETPESGINRELIERADVGAATRFILFKGPNNCANSSALEVILFYVLFFLRVIFAFAGPFTGSKSIDL